MLSLDDVAWLDYLIECPCALYFTSKGNAITVMSVSYLTN